MVLPGEQNDPNARVFYRAVDFDLVATPKTETSYTRFEFLADLFCSASYRADLHGARGREEAGADGPVSRGDRRRPHQAEVRQGRGGDQQGEVR